MSFDLRGTWAWMLDAPLFWLVVTLLAYQAAVWLFERCGRRPPVNPVLVSVVLIIGLLAVTGVDYATYFEGGRLVHILLGPATVVLAVPLYRQLPALARSWPAVLAAVTVGAAVAAASVVAIARSLGASAQMQMTLAPKSVTTPIAMGIAERIGGVASLTAVLVVLTGILGAVAGGWILDRARVRSPAARGLALGVASHAIGTTRAFQEGETQGAFAGLAIGLAGLVTALLVPPLAGLLFSH